MGNSIWVSSFVLRKNRSHLGLYSSQAWEVWELVPALSNNIIPSGLALPLGIPHMRTNRSYFYQYPCLTSNSLTRLTIFFHLRGWRYLAMDFVWRMALLLGHYVMET